MPKIFDMSTKTRKILSFILILIPSAILVMSGFAKLSGNPQVTEGLSKIGFGPVLKILGIAELIFVALFLYPKTQKIGFYLILSYLGGAAAIEISVGAPPMALVYIAFAWIGIFIKDQKQFLPA